MDRAAAQGRAGVLPDARAAEGGELRVRDHTGAVGGQGSDGRGEHGVPDFGAAEG